MRALSGTQQVNEASLPRGRTLLLSARLDPFSEYDSLWPKNFCSWLKLLHLFFLLLATGCNAPPSARSYTQPELAAAWHRCTLCHGTREMQRGPILDGREAWYLDAQLEKFRNGRRGTGTRAGTLMRTALDQFPDANMDAALAKYIASLPPQKHLATVRGDAAAGEKMYASCIACHGPEGEGVVAMNSPRLTGLEDWYMVDQLRKFKKGDRGGHPDDFPGQMMKGAVQHLSDQDIKNLTVYIREL